MAKGHEREENYVKLRTFGTHDTTTVGNREVRLGYIFQFLYEKVCLIYKKVTRTSDCQKNYIILLSFFKNTVILLSRKKGNFGFFVAVLNCKAMIVSAHHMFLRTPIHIDLLTRN